MLVKLYRWLRATDTFLKGHMLVGPGFYNEGLEDSTGNCHVVIYSCWQNVIIVKKESVMAHCITFRYQQLLAECHQCYFTQRELLLSSSVAGSVTELSVTHKGDHCSLVRSSCACLVHVCQDEHQLFYQFFSQPTPLLTWVHFPEIFQPAVYVFLFLHFYFK